MKKVTELKDGMKVWIPFEVREQKGVESYPFIFINEGLELLLTKDCRYLPSKKPIEMYEQEEVPNLTPVEMEVSDDGVEWYRANVIGKQNDIYLTDDLDCFNYARPIQKTVTLEIPEELLTEELRKYLK